MGERYNFSCRVSARRSSLRPPFSWQILCQWFVRAGMALMPLRDAMIHKILESGNAFVDETPIKMLAPGKGKTQTAYMWVLAGGLRLLLRAHIARMDNNVAERAIRPLAIGRKNWLFVGNEDGGEAAAVIYLLIQTCRAIDVNPRVYLEDVMRRLMSHSSNKLDELLPDGWAASRNQITLSPIT